MTLAVEVRWSSLVAADRDLMAGLDGVEGARLAAMERPADRGRSLVGFALLRAVVAEHLGIAPGDVVIDRTCADCGEPHGRPRVRGVGGRAPWVSVSHSGVLVVVALCRDADVGVDVQRIADVAERGDEDGGSAAAAQRWVRGEAVGKLGPQDGHAPVHVTGLQVPLDGYAAALAAATTHDVEVVVGHWPVRSG